MHLGLNKTRSVLFCLMVDSALTREITPREPGDRTLQEDMQMQTGPVRSFVLEKFGSVT